MKAIIIFTSLFSAIGFGFAAEKPSEIVALKIESITTNGLVAKIEFSLRADRSKISAASRLRNRIVTEIPANDPVLRRFAANLQGQQTDYANGGVDRFFAKYARIYGKPMEQIFDVETEPEDPRALQPHHPAAKISLMYPISFSSLREVPGTKYDINTPR